MKVERLSVYVHLTSHWFHIQHLTENTRVFLSRTKTGKEIATTSSSALLLGVELSGDDPVAGHSNRSPHGFSVNTAICSARSRDNCIVSGSTTRFWCHEQPPTAPEGG